MLSPAQIITVAKVLDVSLDDLFGTCAIPKETKTPNIRVRKILEEVDRLPRRQQEKIIDVVEAFVNQKCTTKI